MHENLELTCRIRAFPLTEPFRLSRGTETQTRIIQVSIRHGELVGYGEGCPIGRYEETPEDCEAFLLACSEHMQRELWGCDDLLSQMERVGSGFLAAKAAVDVALHDLVGKIENLPVYRLLGLSRRSPQTSITISLDDPDVMAFKAEKSSAMFQRLKLKLGGLDGLDMERVRRVRSVTKAALVVDVNEFWSFEEALEYLPELARLGVEWCEQPLLAGHLDAAKLKQQSPIPILADEDCRTSEDLPAVVQYAHGISVKVSKVGGIRAALDLISQARQLGLSIMIGCMNESSLGIAAACHIASLCDYADLDGNLLLAQDPWEGLMLENGVQLPCDLPGLGVSERPC